MKKAITFPFVLLLTILFTFSLQAQFLPPKFQDEKVTITSVAFNKFVAANLDNSGSEFVTDVASNHEWILLDANIPNQPNRYRIYHVASGNYLTTFINYVGGDPNNGVESFGVYLDATELNNSDETTQAFRFNALSGADEFRIELDNNNFFLWATGPFNGDPLSIIHSPGTTIPETHKFKLEKVPFGEEVSFGTGIDATKNKLLSKAWYIHDKYHKSLLTHLGGNAVGQKAMLDYGTESQFIIDQGCTDCGGTVLFRIRHRKTGKYLTVPNSNAGTSVFLDSLYDDDEYKKQNFRIEITGELKWKKLVSSMSSNFNTLVLEVLPNGDLIVNNPGGTVSPEQKFTFNQATPNNGEERYSIVGANKGHFVTDLGYQTEGQEVVHNVDTDYASMWNFEDAGAGYYYIRNLLTRNYISAYGATSTGVQMKMTATPGEDAKWELIEADGGVKYRIKNKTTGHYFSTKGENKDGDPLYQAGVNSSGVKWHVIPAGEDYPEVIPGNFNGLQISVPTPHSSLGEYRPLLVSIGLPNNLSYRPAIWNALAWYYQSAEKAERAIRNYNMNDPGHRAEMALAVRQYIIKYLPSIPKSDWCTAELELVTWIENKIKSNRIDFAQRKLDAWETFEQINPNEIGFHDLLYQNSLSDFEAPKNYILDDEQQLALFDYAQMARQQNLTDEAFLGFGGVAAGTVGAGILSGALLSGAITSGAITIKATAGGTIISGFKLSTSLSSAVGKLTSLVGVKATSTPASFSAVSASGPVTVITAAALILTMQVMEVIDYTELEGKIYTAFTKAQNEVIDIHALYNSDYVLGQVNLGRDLDYIFGAFSANATIDHSINNPDGTDFLPPVHCHSQNVTLETTACFTPFSTNVRPDFCYHFSEEFPYTAPDEEGFYGLGQHTFQFISPMGINLCTQNVTVKDVSPPTVNDCPSSFTTQVDANTGCVVQLFWDEPIFSDCQPPTVVKSHYSGNFFPVGITTVSYTATNVSGVETVCSFTIIVNDVDAPSALCREDVTVMLDEYGNSGNIYPEDIDNGSFDNCTGVTLSIDPHPLFNNGLDCSNITEAKVFTLKVTDSSGHESTCTTSVTAVDNIPPIAVCTNQSVVLDANGQGSLSAVDVGGTSYSLNDCETFSFALDKYAFNCADIGQLTVQMTVSDESGNPATCEATVTVSDVTAPEALCQSVAIYLDASGQATLDGSAFDNGSNDACGVHSMSLSQYEFDCSHAGNNGGGSAVLVTLTVKDASGNSSDCLAFVTIDDPIPPNAKCQDQTVVLDDTGNGSLTAEAVNNNSTDNCGTGSMALSQTTFDCTDVGQNAVTLTVNDTKGNSSTCNATVTVVDATQPVVTCQNKTLQLDADGLATLTVADVEASATDACGIGSKTLSFADFDCSYVGVQSVVLHVVDNNSNQSQCTATVFVEDNIAPTITCPADITVSNDPGECAAVVSYDVQAADNCSYTVTQTDGVASGMPFNSGTTTNEYRVTDASGHTATCTFNVTVEKSGDPDLLYAYTIIGLEEVKLKGGTWLDGGIGLADGDEKVKLEKGINVDGSNSFVVANELELKNGSTASVHYQQNFDENLLPVFLTNPNPSQNNVDIDDNDAPVTLDLDSYGEVEIGKNVAVTLTGHEVVRMEKLKLKEGASLQFSQHTTVIVEDKVELKKSATLDRGSHIVWFYVGEDIVIEKSAQVAANMYANDQLTVKKGTAQLPTPLTGLFIANKVDAGQYVSWNWNAAYCPDLPPANLLADSGGTQASTDDQPNGCLDCGEAGTLIQVFPNPASTTVSVTWNGLNPEGTAQLTDLFGRVMIKQDLKTQNQFNVSNLRSGIYTVRVKADGYKQQVERVVVDR